MKKGQIVFVKHTDRDKITIKKGKVVSVGSKYFKVEECENESGLDHFSRMKFSLEYMVEITPYGSEFRVYLSEKEIQDEIDRPLIRKKLYSIIDKMTTDELRELLKKLNN